MPIENQPSRLRQLAVACRSIVARQSDFVGLKPSLPIARVSQQNQYGKRKTNSYAANLKQAFYLSALTLPGLMGQAQADPAALPPATADSVQVPAITAANLNLQIQPVDTLVQSPADADDEVGFQYSHYGEGKRTILKNNGGNLPNNYSPITVDGQHFYARLKPTDRTRFNLNFSEDVWSGATPWFTAPVTTNSLTYTGASYRFKSPNYSGYFDNKGNPVNVSQSPFFSNQLQTAPAKIQQALGYASPEIRDQIDFKLGYDWDNAGLDVGGGTSQERDYLSRFGNLGLRLDFNQKLTTLNMGISYTNSDAHAMMNADTWSNALQPSALNCQGIPNATVCGNRQDAAINLALSQVLSKNAVLSAGFAYTRSSGYLGNPYKGVLAYDLDPLWRQELGLNPNAYPGIVSGSEAAYSANGGGTGGIGIATEQRPGLRNQLTWDTSYRQYVEPLNAAAKLGYSFFHDDWGINAHTFDAEWRQGLFSTWTVTPHVRYYTQTAANFFTPYVFTSDPFNPSNYSTTGMFSNAPLVDRLFSSDQRLAGYGTLSGGVTISKQFSRGLSMELGYEYYAHKSSLEMGGGSNGSYMDFNYFVANAAIHANIGQLTKAGSLYDGYGVEEWLGNLFGDNSSSEADGHAAHHHQHGGMAPAGVMFAHMLDKADQFMVGYRFTHSTIGPGYQQGANTPVNFALNPNMNMYATGMNMNMHMLDLMYAPTDWLNLMLMPQYMDMSMDMVNNTNSLSMKLQGVSMIMPPMRMFQTTGGFADTSGYVLFKLWDASNQHLHLTQGISAPTGSVNITQQYFNENWHSYFPYNMQVGSGTWDYKPSLTYTGKFDDFFWGGQVSGTHRLQQQNSYGWRLGDIFQATAWTGYQLTPWLSGTVRGVYTGQGKLIGQWRDYFTGTYYSMPEENTANSGGSFADAGFGFTATLPKGQLAGNSFSFEWLQPVYSDFQGTQLNRTGSMSATWHYAF